MATTDIDGTPLFILGAKDAEDLQNVLIVRAYTPVVDKLRKFLNDPEVVKWLSVKEDPVPDPCIAAEWASEGVLEENMVICEIHPADWQLEEIMAIRLEAYLKRRWRRLHDEWGYDPAATANYDDGLRCGFAIATRQVASQFNIDLEKP